MQESELHSPVFEVLPHLKGSLGNRAAKKELLRVARWPGFRASATPGLTAGGAGCSTQLHYLKEKTNQMSRIVGYFKA